jgi:aspartate carbamoyltransferase catalytic subunit
MHSFEGKDFISLKGVPRADIELIFEVASQMEAILNARKRTALLHDKLLGLMFFQVSTRTRTSFESAMQRLGGGVVGFVDPKTTRAGDYYAESLEDTVRMMENYADVLVIRHHQDGAPAAAASVTDVPVINAGDGYNEHPTQALLDLYTMHREKGYLEGLKVGLVGDLNLRGTHSLPLGLARFQAKAYFVAPQDARMPKPWLDEFDQLGLDYEQVDSIEEVLPDLDVIYLVGTNPPSYHVAREDARADRPETDSAYRVDREKLARAKSNVIIMHPLPRKDEIPTEVDSHAAARYFVQATYGVAIRMALLALLLGKAP